MEIAKIIERGIKNNVKTISIVIGIIAVAVMCWGIWRSISGLHDNGKPVDSVRTEIRRAEDRQQRIEESADEIERRIDASKNAVEGIQQANTNLEQSIDRIETGSNNIEAIIQRDARIIEECREILADIRKNGKGQE